MARLLFFGKLSDLAGGREQMVTLQPGVDTVEGLIAQIADGDKPLATALTHSTNRFAVNETIADLDGAITDGDEIAFLPPVSGG